jgi:hypothetical protein
MSRNKPIHGITVAGTGDVGAHRAAQYLARGFDVVAADPAIGHPYGPATGFADTLRGALK